MNVTELLSLWEQTAKGELTAEYFSVRLPIEDAAKLHALCQMYPRRPVESLITDLISAALHEVESKLPYQRGDKIIALDEENDPIYEDVGPTPRFLQLAREYLERHAAPKKLG